MKLFLISQTANDDLEVFLSALVCADSEEEARAMHPRDGKANTTGEDYARTSWVPTHLVSVKLIGDPEPSIEKGVIISDFHAG